LGRFFNQLAFAYADLAEWFAALDDKFENVELQRIDELKERLIGQLGGVVDAEVIATQSFDAKFDALVGMQSVKVQIRKFVDVLVVQKRREKRGLKVAPQRLHMAFLGNPGTGKTTVARLYGELLHELGLMNTTKFKEVAGTDFTGVPHIGESEPVMRAAVTDALNGVLFIDEAYSMNDRYNSDNKKGAGLKATDVLVKMMEDHRHELCVILAGYTKPTKEYLEANPGMPSRIGAYIHFPDYSPEDIKAMVPIIAKKKNLLLAEGSLDRLATAIEASRAKTEFGNARSVEKILEEAERNCVARVARLGPLATNRHLSTIEPMDVPDVAPPVPKKTIGFVSAQSPGYL
jgi:SpoVK/Ycf46/Vps4 family AAA+-type ATPase